MFKSYFQKFKKPEAKKSYSYSDLLSAFSLEQETTGVETYRSNNVVHRCISLIATSASHVPWQVFRGNAYGHLDLISHHLIARLLKAPNSESSGADFFIENISNLLLYGNSYILMQISHNNITALYNIHPNLVSQVNRGGKILAYEIGSGESKRYINIDSTSKKSQILHLKSYDPFNNKEGMSAISAAAKAIHLHNKISDWNKALLQNAVRPSGALVFNSDSGHLTDEQFERLERQFYDNFTGASNSGKPLILEGGLQWQETSKAEKFEKFIELKDSSARDIAMAFNIPPQLLGINGDNTYSNMQEARRALWEENLIPLLDKYADALSSWFSYWCQEELVIDFDKEAISVLTEKRESLWNKIETTSFMTINEKRALVGLRPVEGGDILEHHNRQYAKHD